MSKKEIKIGDTVNVIPNDNWNDSAKKLSVKPQIVDDIEFVEGYGLSYLIGCRMIKAENIELTNEK